MHSPSTPKKLVIESNDKTLLRSLIDVEGHDGEYALTAEAFAYNITQVEAAQDRGLRFEQPEHRRIFKLIWEHFYEHDRAPPFSWLILKAADDIELTECLHDIHAVPRGVCWTTFLDLVSYLSAKSIEFTLMDTIKAGYKKLTNPQDKRSPKERRAEFNAILKSIIDGVNALDQGPAGIRASVRCVLDARVKAGPLIHIPTGFTVLDQNTGGGPCYGSRVYVTGAPDASKTLFLVQVLHRWAQDGIAVGIHAIDEEGDDVVTRLAQRLGFSRSDYERADAETFGKLTAITEDLPIAIYGPETTIEDAARDLHEFAKQLGKERAVMFVDSVQTAMCDAHAAASREPSPREAITANVRAIRKATHDYGHLYLCTSEMNRGGYRDDEAVEKANDMATAAESRAIEYSARILISLRSVKDHGDLVMVRIAKNKYGPRYPTLDVFYWKLDRAAQTLIDTGPPAGPESSEGVSGRFTQQALIVWNIVIANPGIGIKDLRAEATAAGNAAGIKIGKDALDALLKHLVNNKKIENRAVPYGKSTRDTWWAISDDVPQPSKEPTGKYDMVETDEDLSWMNGAAANGVN